MPGTDILPGHGSDGGAQCHRRQQDQVIQPLGRTETGYRMCAEAVDQRQDHRGSGMDHHHLRARRHTQPHDGLHLHPTRPLQAEAMAGKLARQVQQAVEKGATLGRHEGQRCPGDTPLEQAHEQRRQQGDQHSGQQHEIQRRAAVTEGSQHGTDEVVADQ